MPNEIGESREQVLEGLLDSREPFRHFLDKGHEFLGFLDADQKFRKGN